MTLYEMTEAAKALYEMLEAEEVDEQVISDTLEGMGANLKLEDYCKIIKQFKADAEQYKAEADRLKKKQAAAEKSVKRLTDRVLAYMSATGKTKEKAGVFNIRVSQSKAVNIINENIIPDDYLITQPAKVDKMKIKKLLLAGEVVAGAELQTNNNLQIK
jgi:hypothetical protein